MKRTGKLPAEEKVEILRKYKAGQLTLTQAALAADVDPTSILRWFARYEAEGIDGFLSCHRNRKYSPELKNQVVKDYLSGGGSFVTLCKKYKIKNTCQVYRWVKSYNSHGRFKRRKKSGGRTMTKCRKTTYEERIAIVEDCLRENKNYTKVALKHNVTYQRLLAWTRKYEAMGEAGLEDRRGKRKKNQVPRTELEEKEIQIKRLEHELHLAKLENEYLKKLGEMEGRDA